MTPTLEFPPVVPATCQMMPVLVVPDTVAENCVDWPACTVALLGEITTVIVGGVATIVTLAFADLVESATLLAVTVTEEPDGTAAGAVYRPPEIVPTVEFPP